MGDRQILSRIIGYDYMGPSYKSPRLCVPLCNAERGKRYRWLSTKAERDGADEKGALMVHSSSADKEGTRPPSYLLDGRYVSQNASDGGTDSS